MRLFGKVNGKKAAPIPANDSASIGNILLRDGCITPEQLQAAVTYQRDHSDVMLGEALVHLGVLDRAVLERAIQQQRALRQSVRARQELVIRSVDHAFAHTRRLMHELDEVEELSQRVILCLVHAK